VLARFQHKPAFGAALVLAATTLAVVASQGAPTASAKARPASGARPNVVLIQADDETDNQFTNRVMPNTRRLLASHGDDFTNYIASTPQCCPSRASLITGQYAHNHGVTSNGRGYPALVDKGNVLPVWLQQAGYYTMHVGKFLNGYESFTDPATVAPGWDQWHTVFGSTAYYDYKYAVNGSLVHHGHQPGDNITHVLNRTAVRLIRARAPSRKPFYLQLDERAPHVSHQPDPFGKCSRSPLPLKTDERKYQTDPQLRKVGVPHPPSFNEADMSDKPPFLAGLPKMNASDRHKIKKHWGCALEALQGVDRGVAQVYRAVKRSGDLNRTVFIFTSDNGLFYGQHRIPGGKVLPYTPSFHLPLVIRAPKRFVHGAAPHQIGRPVANIDLAPTILRFAHAQPCAPGDGCRTMDGRSLMPLLRGSGRWPKGRGILTEYNSIRAGRYATCQFAGIRTRGTSYVEYSRVIDQSTGNCVATDQRERYDFKSDPFELDNLCSGGGPFSCPVDSEQVNLEQRLDALRHCSGIKGRDSLGPNHDYCE
jgi:N-acetylglucosamine-6-sulfatase